MEVTLLMTIFFFFFAIFVAAAKNSGQVYDSKKPDKTKTKTFEMYGFHICVIFFPEF